MGKQQKEIKREKDQINLNGKKDGTFESSEISNAYLVKEVQKLGK